MADGSQGYISGFAQLGCFKIGDALTFVFVQRGDDDSPAPGTLNAWIAAPTTFQQVRMTSDYWPSTVGRYPVRAMLRGGETAMLPQPEATALIAAGGAVAA